MANLLFELSDDVNRYLDIDQLIDFSLISTSTFFYGLNNLKYERHMPPKRTPPFVSGSTNGFIRAGEQSKLKAWQEGVKNADIFFLVENVHRGDKDANVKEIIREFKKLKSLDIYMKLGFEEISLLSRVIRSGTAHSSRKLMNIFPGAAKMVKAMIKLGADVNIRNLKFGEATGDTPIFSVRNNSEVLEMLIDAGVDLNIKNENDLSPFLLSILDGSDKDTIKFFTDSGVDINENYDGLSALFYAVNEYISSGYKDIETVESLINLGADLNYIATNDDRETYGKTVLEYAKSRNLPKVINLIESVNNTN